MNLNSVPELVNIYKNDGHKSIAFPLLGTGTGRFSIFEAVDIMLRTMQKTINEYDIVLLEIVVVLYGRTAELIDINEAINRINK